MDDARDDIIDRVARLIPGPLGRLLSAEQGRYLVIAGTTAVCYLGLVAAGLSAGLPYMLAISAAQVVTIACAFPAYRILIFRSTGRVLGDFARFLSVWSGGMVAGFVGTPLLVEVVGMAPLPAQVLAVVVVAVGSYLGHRFFSFRHRSPSRPVSLPHDPS